MEKRQPLMTIRPQFSPLLAILESLAAGAVGTVALTFVGGTLLLAFLSIIGLGWLIPGSMIYGLVFVLGIMGIPVVYYEIKQKNFRRTVYNFYSDYVEFQNFQHLVNRRVGRVSYRDITNVAEQANLVQQREKITTIYLFAPGVEIPGRGGFAGIKIADVAQSAEWTEKILELLDQSRRPPATIPPAQAVV